MSSADSSIGLGFPTYALSRALTAASHPDPAVRSRAAERVAKWSETLAGMESGDIRVGSRRPTSWPEWVTLNVMWGGFAHGSAKAAAIEDDERDLIAELCGEQSRKELFQSCLSDTGLKRLYALLDSGEYEVRVPEDSALLTVAWLLRKGDVEAALDVLETITPYASRLRFAPRTAPSTIAPGLVWTMTASEATAALMARRDPPAIVRQRHNLSEWAPLASAFFELWYPLLREDGWVAVAEADITEMWRYKAAALVLRFDGLPKISRHARPKSNIGRLVEATRCVLEGKPVEASLGGHVRHALQSMLAKLGPPGSDARKKLANHHAHVASQPSHAAVGRVFARRLQDLNANEGIPASTPGMQAPINDEDLRKPPVPGPRRYRMRFDAPTVEPVPANDELEPGTELTPFVRHVLQRVVAAPAAELVANRALPSAEAYARVLPLEFAGAIAEEWADEALGRLMARTFIAFAQRRSLLLTDLAHQVRWTELPWVQAAMNHLPSQQEKRDGNSMEAMLHRAAGTTLKQWPGTILPNKFVSSFNALSRLTPAPVSLLEELAADIFWGRFSPKFAQAVHDAGPLMGPLYARYYSIDLVQSARVGDKRVPKRVAPKAVPDPVKKVKVATPSSGWVAELSEEASQGESLHGETSHAASALEEGSQEETLQEDDDWEEFSSQGCSSHYYPSEGYTSQEDMSIDGRSNGEQPVDLYQLCQSRCSVIDNRTTGNGLVLEQCQILSTHNLSTVTALLSPAELNWETLADGAWRRCLSHLGRVARLISLAQAETESESDFNRWSAVRRKRERYMRMLRSTKQAAYAWRQAVFFLSQLEQREQDEQGERYEAQQSESNSGVHTTAERSSRRGVRSRPGAGAVERFIGERAHALFAKRGGESVPGRAVAEVAESILAELEAARRGNAPKRVFLGWSSGAHWVIEDMKNTLKLYM